MHIAIIDRCKMEKIEVVNPFDVFGIIVGVPMSTCPFFKADTS